MKEFEFIHNDRYFLVKFALMISLSLIIIMGNSWLILIYLTSAKMKNMPRYRIIFSLAMGDLLFGLVIVLKDAFSTGWKVWLFSYEACKIWKCFTIFLANVSVLHIVFLAVDQYLIMRNTLNYMGESIIKRYNISLSIIWLICFTFAACFYFCNHCFPPYGIMPGEKNISPILYCQQNCDLSSNRTISAVNLLPGNDAVTLDDDGHFGLVKRKCYMKINLEVALMFSSFSFFAPILIIVVFCVLLVTNLRKHTNNIFKIANITSNCKIKRIKQDQKAIKFVILLLFCFLICWTPFFSMILTLSVIDRIYDDDFIRWTPEWIIILITWIAYANSAVNPIIYFFIHRRLFRHKRTLVKLIENSKFDYTSHTRLSLISTSSCKVKKWQSNIFN
ncbi:unnamed protein product [Gordionus sp. m RMFG-2023]